MRFVVSRRRIPKCFSRHPNASGLVAEADISPHPQGRLAAKLLVFDGPKSLRRFWKTALGNDVGRECRGAVNAMAVERSSVGKSRPSVLMGDARYFCIIGLCLGSLSMEVVTHEAVHAGFCYEKRVKRNLFGRVGDFDEERIAYPAGAIAAAINKYLHSKALYEKD